MLAGRTARHKVLGGDACLADAHHITAAAGAVIGGEAGVKAEVLAYAHPAGAVLIAQAVIIAPLACRRHAAQRQLVGLGGVDPADAPAAAAVLIAGAVGRDARAGAGITEGLKAEVGLQAAAEEADPAAAILIEAAVLIGLAAADAGDRITAL